MSSKGSGSGSGQGSGLSGSGPAGSRSIQVAIKVRPCEPGLSKLWQVREGRSIQLADSHAEPCVFDSVFDEGAGNQEVFDRMAKHIVHACIQGFNGTIFAYGQTSSGKTYTMMGDAQNPGVMVLAAKEIFRRIAEEKDRDFLLRVGYIEIYNEKIYDLLEKKNQDLKIHEVANGMVHVNCEESIITCEEELLRHLSMGNKERTTGETNMNERSSRSHAIFRIIIESRKSDCSEDVIQSVLNLVDLAGSERADQTGATGARLKEGGHINKSLLFLSNVIKNLAERENENGAEQASTKFISFRDSKLTRILQASLGGNAYTSIICTIKPSVLEESQSTISFAMRAKKIKTKPQLNEMVSDATMMKRLEREIQSLKDRLAEEQRKNESQLKVQELERCIKRDMLKIISSTSLSDKCLQKRRRTWCPGQEAAQDPSKLAVDSQLQPKISQLPKPTFFATAHGENRKTINIFKSLDISTDDYRINEEFVPSECVDFDAIPKDFQRGKLHSTRLPLTPVASEMRGATVENLKKEIQELQTFTKLEKHFDGEWEKIQKSLDEVTTQRDQLQQRCELLEAEVAGLKAHDLEASTKAEGCQKEMQALREAMARLELENREAITLEFQFKAHKERSAMREKDLLSALAEKEAAIENLQKSLDEMSRDVLCNSKEDLMRSLYQPASCHKCDDLDEMMVKTKASEERCQIVETENMRLQAVIESLKERAEQTQTQLAECARVGAENESLHSKLSDLQASFDEIQREYDCLSNQLMESVQESDALREELKQRPPGSGMWSMKSSGLGTESGSESAEELNLLGEFARLAESIHQIELQHKSGSSRLYRAVQWESPQDRGVHHLKLSLASAKYVEEEAPPSDACDSTVLRGSLRQHRFQIVRLSEEQLGEKTAEELRLLGIIEQLQDENIMNINEMREQITSLESALLEKSVIVNRVEDYQRQIESLEKQNAEMSLVCEALKESTMCIDETVMGEPAPESGEVAANLTSKMCQLQAELDNQLKQLQLKDSSIEQLQAEIQELRESCLSMEVGQVELRAEADQKQQQLERQTLKLSEDALLIDQLQESNAKHADRCIKAEESLREYEERLAVLQSKCEQDLPEHGKRFAEIEQKLEHVNAMVAAKTQENADLKLEYLQKLEEIEGDNRAKFRNYKLEWEESRESYESSMASLNEKLLQASEEMKQMTSRHQEELQDIRGSYERKLSEAGVELDRTKETLNQKLEELALHSEKLSVTEAQLAEIKSGLEEAVGQRDLGHVRADELEKASVEINARLEQLLLENRENKSLYEQSQKLVQQLQEQLKVLELDNSNQALQELQRICQNQVVDLEKLQQEKANLQCQIEDANSLGSRLSQRIEELETEMQAGQKQSDLLKEVLEGKVENLLAKVGDLELLLEDARADRIEHDGLAMKHGVLEKSLASQTQLISELEQKVNHLNTQLTLATDTLDNRDQDVELLRKELQVAQAEKEEATSEHSALSKRLREAEDELSRQAAAFEKKLADLDSFVAELHLKLESLQELKQKLDCENEELKVQLQNTQNLQGQLEEERARIAQLRESQLQLEEQTRAKDAEFSLRSAELNLEIERKGQAVADLTRECDHLRSDLASKSAADTRLEASQEEVAQLKSSLATIDEKVKAMVAEFEERSLALHRELELERRALSERDKECYQLRSDLANSKEEVNAQTAEFSLKSSDLNQALELERQAAGELAKECEKWRCELVNMEGKFKAKNEEFSMKSSELNRELELERKAVVDLTQECERLRCELLEMEQLKNSQAQLEQKLKAKEAEVDHKSLELSQAVEVGRRSLGELTDECQKLRTQLDSQTSAFQLEKEHLDRQIANLLKQNTEMDDKLKVLMAKSERDAAESSSKLEAAKKQYLEANHTIEGLTKESEKMRSTLKSKEASFRVEGSRLEGTIASLLEDKRNLEEKICSLEDIVSRLESEVAALQASGLKANGSNLSFDSNTSAGSPSTKPAAGRKSLERNPHGAAPRKSISIDTEVRKSRRISVHDENRRYSYWNDVRECGTMTDPVDSICSCPELSSKLETCQRDLFIRDSQLSALKMELLHHPLKDENAQLKKRVLDEQEKARAEQKRLRQKIHDLNTKMSSLSGEPALSKGPAEQVSHKKVMVVETQTQTESEMEQILEKTNLKYQETIRLCRFRAGIIKDLEEKLKQNENVDTSNICSLTDGQISSLKAQCASQKKEMSALREKYEAAKKVLLLRKDEIHELRAKISTLSGSTQ
ncbi:hypothetical protein KR018_004239 [Drosophila ironensis]|nr:hypothetical protein KR018_004239 [Drosophila ironensis]